MADNFATNTASGGETFASDDIGGIQHTRVKVQHGTDGSATDVSTSSPLPVSLANGTVVPGTGATNLGKAEDAVHASGDVGVMALGVRNDDLTPTGADGDYTPFQTDEDGAVWVHQSHSDIDASNSTTSILAASNLFIGTGTDLLSYATVSIIIDSSHDSAADGMLFEFSTDNANWDKIFTFTYTAADGARVFQFPVHAQYFRLVYINGGTNQTHFRVQAILLHASPVQTTHRLIDSVDPDRSVTVVKSAIIAQGAGTGDFIPVQATAGGNLKVSLEEIVSPVNGGTEVAALRVTIANDSTGLLSVDDNGGSLTVDGTVTADAGTGPWPVTDNGGSLTVDNPALAVTGGGAEATALRVTVANDSTGLVSVDDGGGSLTVDGTVTANLSAADNAVLDQIELNTDSGTVVGGGVEAAALRVTIANDSTGLVSVDDNGGSLTVDSADLSTIAGAVTGTEMQVDIVTDLAKAATADNIGAALMTNVIHDGITAITPKFAIIDAASSGDNTLITAVAAKKIRVLALMIVSAGTVNVRLESGAAGAALSGQMNLVVNSGFTLPFNPVGWCETAVNTLLNLELSAAVSCDGLLTYIEV